MIDKLGYINNNDTYWLHLRKVFRELIIMNIMKGNRIQNSKTISRNNYKEGYNNIDLEMILNRQNDVSRDTDNGYIWILNTCIFIVAEYNIKLLDV